MFLESFYSYSVFKKKYSTQQREPFFAIALKYCRLLKQNEPVIIDIGSGEGDFFSYLGQNNFPTNNISLLDANEATVRKNKSGLTAKSIHYTAPDPLPFEDGSVGLIHTSHMIEYLAPAEMYGLMKEMDRVLSDGGYIVISAPLIWDYFYNDLGHIRPYNPIAFHKYFINLYANSHLDKISSSYQMKELVYRYCQMPLDEGWSSSMPAIDFMLITIRRVLSKLGFRRMRKNGYTLVLSKLIYPQ